MVKAKLSSFMVYNPTYGPKEGQEHLKVLYYHPDSENPDVKVNNVGLCEALVQFAKTYSPDKPCEALHTQKHRQAFYEPEENFWFVMTVSNPWNEVMNDNQPVKEYHEENIKDIVLKAVLKRAYQMFKIFMGSLESIVSVEGVESLKLKLKDFYYKYLPDIDIEHRDIVDVFNGVVFLPTEKTTHLKIQSFLNSVTSTFPEIKYTVLMYEDKLLWSGLTRDDTRVMYAYLANKLLPTSSEFESGLISGYLTREGSHGRFLAGVRYYEHSTDRHVTTVFLHPHGEVEKVLTVTYQALDLSITLFLSGDSAPSIDTFRKMDNAFGRPLVEFSTVLEAEAPPPSRIADSAETLYKFIYFNHGNLSLQSSCHHRNKHGFLTCTMPDDVMRVVLTICQEFSSKTDSVEVVTKASSDYWVFAKKFDNRHECYIVINQKNANLIDVNEEVRKICQHRIPDVFIAD